MNPVIDRLKIFFLGLFFVLTIGILVVHYVWIWPGKQCEQAHNWWDWRTRTCAHPIPISDITGRLIKDDASRDAAKAALAQARAKGASQP